MELWGFASKGVALAALCKVSNSSLLSELNKGGRQLFCTRQIRESFSEDLSVKALVELNKVGKETNTASEKLFARDF